MVDIKELCEVFNTKARCEALKKMLCAKRNHVVAIDGLAGSAAG